MKKFWRLAERGLGFLSYTIFVMGCWTLVVILSIIWRLNQETHSASYLAHEIARSHLEKDLILRDWNIHHGFVYAPVTPKNQPNPNLNMSDRDILTSSGKTLTAIDSSTMIRQIYELAEKKIPFRGHLTSLTPLRPENAPDPWEHQALEKLANGAKEVSEIVNQNGCLYFRLIQPLTLNERCLTGHAQEVPGQVGGGISVTLPMTSVVGAWERGKVAVFMAHGFLWLVGLLGLTFGSRQLQRKIRAQQEAETALRQSEGNFHLLIKNIPALVYRGYADGRVDFVDDKVEKLTGYSKQEFSSGQTRWPDLIMAEDRAASKKILIQALKSDAAYRREYRIRRRDGEIIWVAERSQIVFDPKGQIRFISGVVFDISLQKEMELALKESELFWKTLLEGVGVGLMVIDKVNGRVTEVNLQAIAMLGYGREQIIGQNRQKFFVCPAPQEISKKPGGWENRSEGNLVKADSTLIPVWKTAAPIKIGELEYVLVSFMDMTDQRQAEAALTQANKDLQAAMGEVRQANKEINLIGKMVALLQVCQNPSEAFPIIGQYTQELFPGIAGALYLLNDSNNLLISVNQWGQTTTGEQIFSPSDCWALRQGKPYFCGCNSKVTINPRCHHLAADVQGSSFCIPLAAQSETMGLLYLGKLPGTYRADKTETDLSTSQQKLARTLAENISLSLANLRLRESLRHQAIRDALTGLFNRRYLQETLEREIHRAKRKETSLGVIMMDVDHFKVFNDTHGHEAGDRLLAVLGQYLRSAIRMEDIACRYGGEEFTLILPDVTSEALLRRAEMIRAGTRNLEVLHQGKPLERVTISLGLSYFPQHGADGESLLQAADEALYQAKRSGRDRVVMAGCQLQGRAGEEHAA